MSTPVLSTAEAKREVLQELALALGVLASRFNSQGEAARQIGLLTARAEELAAQAWTLASANAPGEGEVSELLAAITAFIDETVTLSRSAAREASENQALAVILGEQASELDTVGRALAGVNDMTLIRARLRPLLSKLEAIPQRLKAMTEVATDVAELGDRARALTNAAQGLNEKGRNTGIAAVAIYRELRGFADAAGTVATRMSENDQRIRQTLANMSDQTNRLASPEAAAAAQRDATALGRMQKVIAERTAGQGAGRPEGPKPLRGMGWGYAPRQSR
jgi:hypothetical protein